MKKTYLLSIEGKNANRLLDACKHDIRKYVKRERAKPLPEGVDFWDFDCKLGAGQEEASVVHIASLIPSIDALVLAGATYFYVELIAKHGHRTARAAVSSEDQPSVEG